MQEPDEAPTQIGEVKPGYYKHSQYTLEKREGTANIFRSSDGNRFQAEYRSDKLVIVSEPELDILNAVQNIDTIIEKCWYRGDDEVRAMLPKERESYQPSQPVPE